MRAPRSFQGSVGFVLAAVAVAAGGCLGGQSTDDSEECKLTRTKLNDDELAPALGFAPAAVLGWALEPRIEQATWVAPPARIQVSAAPAATELRYGLARRAGAAVEIVGESWCNYQPRLEIPVVAAVTTSEGALSESLPGTLTASRVGFANLQAKLGLEVEGGSLEIGTDDPELRMQPWFSASLTPRASTGGVGVTLERHTPVAVSTAGGFSVLEWPVDSACNHEVIAQELEASDPDWAQPLTEAGTSSWSGMLAQDGTPLSATVTLELAGVLCESGGGRFTAPVTLRVSFADQRPGLTLQSVLTREQDGLELLPPPEGPGGYWGGAPEMFATRHSTFGLDLSLYDAIELRLTLSLANAAMRGSLTLVGLEDTCKTSTCGPNGCNGCGPLLPVVLLELASQPP